MDSREREVGEFLLQEETQRIDAVFVNGVPQAEGRDYPIDGSCIRFGSPRRRRSSVEIAGWILTALCAGVDAEGDSLNTIITTPPGRRSVTLQPVEPVTPGSAPAPQSAAR